MNDCPIEKKTSKIKANTLYYNEKLNHHYYAKSEEIFTKFASYTENSHLSYFHHLREDSISYNNFSNDGAFKEYIYIQSAGYFITSNQYFCKRDGLKSYLILSHLKWMWQANL